MNDNDEEARDTIPSEDWQPVNPDSIDVFDDRPTLRSPIPPPPSTRRTWSTLLHSAAGFLDALGEAVSRLEYRTRRKTDGARLTERRRGSVTP